MATWTNNNRTYYINPAYLTFNENSGYGANLIQVSASSSCYISVYDPVNGIDYSDADKNYQRWKITAHNNKFPDRNQADRGKWHIYVRMEHKGTAALIVYSLKEIGIHGGEIIEKTDEFGNVEKVEGEYDKDGFPYYYIRIGEVGPTNGTSIRSISYDTGYLESKKGETDSTTLNEMWQLDKFSTPWLIKAKQWLSDFTVKGFVKLVGGFMFKKGDVEKAVRDIKRSFDSDEEFLLDEEGEVLLDEKGNPISDPNYVPVSDETIPSTKYVQMLSDDRYLRKDRDDRSKGVVASDKGFEVGTFIEGITGGSGAKVYQDESGKTIVEADKAHFREELLVPKITFNSIDVVSGEMAQTFAFGTIKSVTPYKDATGIAELDLLDDEYGMLHLEDLCRGTFYNLGGRNVDDGEEDENGFLNYEGYTTSYFTPVEFMENSQGKMKFRYRLQDEKTSHPYPGMKFYAYGNSSVEEPKRKSITVRTRTYDRRLAEVDTWKIDPDRNIMMQSGDLGKLVIGGQPMSGYSSFQKNIYLSGSAYEFTPQQKEELKGDDAYSVALSSYVGTVRVNEKGEFVSGEHAVFNVVSSEENVITEDSNVVTSGYLLSTRAQASLGDKELVYGTSGEKDTFYITVSPVGCKAVVENGVVYISEITNTEYCYVSVTFMCEGKWTRELTYEIKVAKDGLSFFKNTVFRRTNSTPETPTGGAFESPVPQDKDENDDPLWNDGIPGGEELLWASTCTFVSNGKYPEDAKWSTPMQMTDTADFEAIYSPLLVQPPIPEGFKKTGEAIDPEWEALAQASGWYDDPDLWNVEGNEHNGKPTVWMATSAFHNGVWGKWSVSRILGEKGEDGDSALILVASTSVITRNSFGSFEPQTIYVKAMVAGVETPCYLTVYGIYQKNKVGVLDQSELRSSVTLDVHTLYALDYDRLEFRAYISPVNDFNNPNFIAQATVNFMGEGKSGAMPRNRGKYSSTETYLYNDEYRDFVWHTPDGQETKVFMRDAFGISFEENNSQGGITNIEPGTVVDGVSYWVEVPKDTLTAIDTALIDTANIAGFVYKDLLMVSQDYHYNTPDGNLDATIILDGNTGYFKCTNADVRGSITAGIMSFKVKYNGGNLTGYGMAYGQGVYTLPSLKEGEVVEIKAYCEQMSRFAPTFVFNVGNTAFLNEHETVDYIVVAVNDSESDAWATREATVSPEVNSIITFVGHGVRENGVIRTSWTVGGTYGLSGQSVKIVVDSSLSEESVYPVQNRIITEALKKFVTLKDEQEINGAKNFTGGLKVNGNPLVYNAEKGYWKMDGDLLVTGGIFMFSSDTAFDPFTITDGVNIDNKTIIKKDGKLMINLSYEFGGGLDETELDEFLSVNKYAKQAYVDQRVSDLVNGAPEAYDTLKEIADVLQKNVNSIGDILTAVGKKADKATTLEGYGITDAYTKEEADGRFVKSNGGILEYDKEKDCWVLGGDLVVSGGVSMFSNTTGYTPSTIMDAVVTDGSTIINDNGVLKLNPNISIGGGSTSWYELKDKPTTISGFGITDAKISNGTITLGNSSITPLPKDGGTLNGTLIISPNNEFGSQAGLVLHDSGSGSGEALFIKWTSTSYSTGVQLYAKPDTKELFFDNDKVVTESKADKKYLKVTDFTTHTNPLYVTSIGLDDKGRLTYEKNGLTSELTIPYATKTSRFIRKLRTGGTLDLNTALAGGGIAYNYNSTDTWVNAPSGMSYGQVLQLSSGDDDMLAGQLAWDVNHKTSATTRSLWWRARDEYGWGNANWMKIPLLNPYLMELNGTKIHWHNDSNNYYIDCVGTSDGAKLDYKAYSGHSFFSGGHVERLTILSNGNVGIGVVNPDYKLHVNGDILSTGGITMYSDIRKKTKLEDVELTIEEVADAPLIKHYYNDDESKTIHVGSIAQYWAEKNDWFCKEDGEGYLTMEVQNAALASAISIAREFKRYKEQSEEKIVSLEKRLESMERMLNQLIGKADGDIK